MRDFLFGNPQIGFASQGFKCQVSNMELGTPYMKIEPMILFLRNWISKQNSLSFFWFFVGILTSNDILIEVPKFN